MSERDMGPITQRLMAERSQGVKQVNATAAHQSRGVTFNRALAQWENPACLG